MKLLVFAVLLLTAAAAAQGFDPPLKKQVVDYGVPNGVAFTDFQPPDAPGTHRQVPVPHDMLACFYYRHLMVKELTNQWNKCDKSLSLVRFERTRPACAKEQAPTEKVLGGNECVGYFGGVKGDLVFLNGDDGVDGGLPFAVYDSKTGQKIFEDNAYEAGMWNKKLSRSPFDQLRVSGASDGKIVLSYLRVVGTECDITTHAAECWPPLVQKLGLKSTAVPHCSGYEEIHQSPYPSSVAYPVEVTLFPTPATRVIAGPIKCWPVD